MGNKKDLVIIFDFDGTIANTSAHWKDIFNELSGEFKFREVADEEWERLRGEKTRDFFKKIGIPLFKVSAVMKKAREIIGQKIQIIKPVEGIEDVLNIFKKEGYKIGILTSNYKENVKAFLRNNNFNMFDFIYSENNMFGKGGAMEKIIKKEGLDSEKVFYIGDEDRDIEAAKKAGVKAIAVAWGTCTEELLLKEKPDFIAKTPKGLISILKNL